MDGRKWMKVPMGRGIRGGRGEEGLCGVMDEWKERSEARGSN